LDGIDFNDRVFFQEQREEDRRWKWPINLAIAFHVVVFAVSIFLPDLICRRPLLDTIVTVDLVSMPEENELPSSPAKPLQKPVPLQAKVEPPLPEPKAAEVSVAPASEVSSEPSAPEKLVSLKPLHRKIRKAKDTRLIDEKAEPAKRRAEQLRRKRALAEARSAQQEAERAAARARQELAAVIRERGAVRATGRSSGRKVQSAVLKQYLSSLYDRVHSYWILPEMRAWDRHLETIIVLTILRDGSIADMQIERKSRDPFFDQFVMKTLQNAAPMPRFPALMRDSSLEVGLRFKPGELAM
jgi:colicin import membrane protein